MRAATPRGRLAPAIVGLRAFGLHAATWTLLALAFAAPASAQVTLVTGTVRDASSGAPINAALVALDGTSARAISVQDGSFALRAPAPGRYDLRVQGYGYSELTRPIVVSEGMEPLALELRPLPVLLDSLTVGQRRVDVDGNVRDVALDVALMDVEVLVDGAPRAVTNPRGNFGLDDLWEGTPTRVSLRAFGYLPVDTVILPRDGLDLDLALTPDPLIEKLMAAQVERLQDRMGGRRTITRPPLDRERLMYWRGLSLLEVLEFSRMGGMRCLFIDEELVPQGWEREMLMTVLPGELHRVESLFGGGMIRVYTRDFMRRMLSGAVELRRPVYVTMANPPLCR